MVFGLRSFCYPAPCFHLVDATQTVRKLILVSACSLRRFPRGDQRQIERLKRADILPHFLPCVALTVDCVLWMNLAPASPSPVRLRYAQAPPQPALAPLFVLNTRTSRVVPEKRTTRRDDFGGCEAQRARPGVAPPALCHAHSFASLTSPKWGIGRPLAGRDADEQAARI